MENHEIQRPRSIIIHSNFENNKNAAFSKQPTDKRAFNSATCIIHCCSYSIVCIVDWMWKWESWSEQFKKPPLREGDRTNGDDTPSWLQTPMTSFPLRLWQLSTSSRWQPDECSEWVVTLATAMLSWPSPYILPDSPHWQWAQHTHIDTVNNAHTHTYTHTHTQFTKHTQTCAHTLSFWVFFFISEMLTQTIPETHTETMHMPTRPCSFGHNDLIQRQIQSPMG